MKLLYHIQTHPGDRADHQDAYCEHIAKNYAVLVLADGLGGSPDGGIIANALCASLKSTIMQHQADIKRNGKQTLALCYQQSLEQIKTKLTPAACHPKAQTTLALLWLDAQQVLTLHIGDTRIYRITAAGIQWRTRDHSVTQMLLDEGDISETEMATHPDQNRLFKSVRLHTHTQPTIKHHSPPQLDETFILCTDGLWSQVDYQDMVNCGQANISESSLATLTQKAYHNAQGHSDNITWQWLRIL